MWAKIREVGVKLTSDNLFVFQFIEPHCLGLGPRQWLLARSEQLHDPSKVGIQLEETGIHPYVYHCVGAIKSSSLRAFQPKGVQLHCKGLRESSLHRLHYGFEKETIICQAATYITEKILPVLIAFVPVNNDASLDRSNVVVREFSPVNVNLHAIVEDVNFQSLQISTSSSKLNKTQGQDPHVQEAWKPRARSMGVSQLLKDMKTKKDKLKKSNKGSNGLLTLTCGSSSLIFR
ncbi:hypothetical protein V6N13_004334 [Hibiscus sabdariffa]